MIDLTPKYLKPGMVMAQSVYNSCGANYLVKGTKLTEQYVKKLRDLGVEGIHVVSTETDSAVMPSAPVLQEQTRALAVKHVYDVFSMAKQEGTFEMKPLEKAAAAIVNDVTTRRFNLVQLTEIRTHDVYTFAHSVNVAMLMAVQGALLHMSRSDLLELTLGGLLHDLGKVRVPTEILNKPGKLSEQEFDLIRRHPGDGAMGIRRTLHAAFPRAAIIAAEHHEHIDGKGYPLGLKGKDIHLWGKIAAIADVYDALTSERAYKRPYTPSVAYKLMKYCSHGQFDEKLLDLFFKNVAIYPVGTVVKTTMGFGIVKRASFGKTICPVIALFADPKAKRCGPFVVDFSQQRDQKVESEINGLELYHFIHQLDFDPAELLEESS